MNVMYKQYREESVQGNTGVSVNLTEECSLKGNIEWFPGGSRMVNAFLGIPYAQPPTGERRFQPPQPVQLWQGERQAVKFGKLI